MTQDGAIWQAQNCLDILQMKLDLEEKQISAAFKKLLGFIRMKSPSATVLTEQSHRPVWTSLASI